MQLLPRQKTFVYMVVAVQQAGLSCLIMASGEGFALLPLMSALQRSSAAPLDSVKLQLFRHGGAMPCIPH